MSDKTLTRADLVDSVVKSVGLPRHEAAELVETVLQELSTALARGEPVKLSSFGSFGIREKRQRIGRNPKTGEEVPITPRRVLVFRASNIMKKRIDETIKTDLGKSNGKAKGKVTTSRRTRSKAKPASKANITSTAKATAKGKRAAKTSTATKAKTTGKTPTTKSAAKSPKTTTKSTAKKSESATKGKKSTVKKAGAKKSSAKKATKGSRK